MQHIASLSEGSRAAHLLGRWGQRILDGNHSWGDLNIGLVDRTGHAMRYQLTVYPPGITATERRALVFRSRWPGIGLLIGILLAVALGSVGSGWTALALGAVVYLIGALVGLTATSRTHRRVLRIRAVVITTQGHRDVLGELDTLKRAASMLLDMEECERRGALTPVEAELVWSAVYDRLAQAIHESRPAPTR